MMVQEGQRVRFGGEVWPRFEVPVHIGYAGR